MEIPDSVVCILQKQAYCLKDEYLEDKKKTKAAKHAFTHMEEIEEESLKGLQILLEFLNKCMEGEEDNVNYFEELGVPEPELQVEGEDDAKKSYD